MSGSSILDRVKITLVILSRILAGGAFALAGIVKCIDPYGFVYKIEDYLAAWDLNVLPSLEVVAAFGISLGEFSLGMMILLGCYRRVAPVLLTVAMAFMLPLTAYIWAADPVADCGCFGDFIILSNRATFWKNVLLTVLAVILLLWNKKVICLVKAPFQWIVLFSSIAFAFVVAYIGYIYQPLIDFRPYPVGGPLVSAPSDDESGEYEEADEGEDVPDEDYVFIYSRNGEIREFSIDSLPDDSWEFVDRKELGNKSISEATFEVFAEDGTDVSSEVISSEGDLLLVMIPNAAKLGLSRAHLIRALGEAMSDAGGEMNVIISGDQSGNWREKAAEGLNVYEAEDTKIKEVVRGEIGLVYLHDGIISWKLDGMCLPTDYLDNRNNKSSDNPLGRLAVDSKKWLISLSSIYISIILVLSLLPWILSEIFHRNRTE